MNRIIFFCLVYAAMSFTQLSGQSQISKNIYFPFDSYALDDSSEKEIEEFVSNLKAYTEHEIKIVGHTDQDGSNEYNLELSKKRAESVNKFLQGHGASISRVDMDYKGENQLIRQSDDAQSKKENRRVTLVADVYNYSNTEEFLELLDDNVNTHVIDPSKETNLNLKKGTELSIPSDAFCLPDGTPIENKNVDITVKEAFSYMDMIDHQLYTQTEDGILETGGMLYIEASQNGERLILRDGKLIDIKYPAQEPLKNMELFVPVQAKSEGLITNGADVVWESTGTPIESKEEKPAIEYKQVDLGVLINFDFGEQEAKPTLTFEEMPKFPRKMRKPYPPSKRNYSEEKYQEVYKKYEVADEKYQAHKLNYPTKLLKWQKEVVKRKSAIRAHKQDLKKYYTTKRLRKAVKQLEEKQASENHNMLLTNLFGFLDAKMPEIPFNEKHEIRKAFGNVSKDVREQVGFNNIIQESYFDTPAKYAPTFNVFVKAKIEETITGKYSSMAINSKLASSYVFSTSDLGWINCDRFAKVAEKDKTKLVLGNTEQGDRLFMIFKGIKSVIGPNTKDRKTFKDIPKGEIVTLIGIKFVNDHVEIGSQEIKTGSVKKMDLEYKPSTLNKLKEIIQKITSE